MRVPSRLVSSLLRHIEKRNLARENDISKLRRRFSFQARYFFQNPPFAAFQPDHLGRDPKVPCLWVSANAPTGRGVILYFHGGGYVMGSPETHRAMLARLSSLTGLRALLPEYRLCPEHPFPAAPEDALSAYSGLLERGYPADKIVLGGDSAGGGLMLALLHLICTCDLPRPAAAFAFSPWTDLTLSGETLVTNKAADVLLPSSRIAELREMYLDGADARDPRASPLFGTFPGAPAVHIEVGDSEILLDDSRRMSERLMSQNIDVRLVVNKELPHVWPIFQGIMRESDQTLQGISRFIDNHLA